ncbi:MAG: DUF4129 domain-containing protein [Bacteroidia bacterium]
MRTILTLYIICLLGISMQAQRPKAEPELRGFDQDKLEAYYNDTNYKYGKKFRLAEKQQQAKDAFWSKLGDFATKDRVANVNFLQMLLAAIVVFTVFFVALNILGVDIRRLFKRQAQQIAVHDEELAEDLRELNFDQLLDQASGKGDFRRGVRLLYLETLKMLTEKNTIRYAKHKTNYEYLLAMRNHPLYEDFELLTLRFDYVWYGNFKIDQAGFDQVTKTFRHFQQNLTRTPKPTS